MLNIEKILAEDSLTLLLSGKVDTATSPELDAVLTESLGGVNHLTVDIKDVEYITSAGLRVLLATHNLMEAKQGTMVLRNVSDAMMHVFDMTGFSEWMHYE